MGSRSDRSLLDDPVPDINVPVLVPTIVPRMIKTVASKVKDIVKKSTEAVIDWAEWLRNAGKDIVVKHVSPNLKMLKEKVDALFKAGAQQTFELKQSSSALKKFATQYVIEGREGYDPQTFLSDVKREVTNLLENNRKTKVKLILRCIMEKTNIADGQRIEQPAAFHSDVEVNLEGTDVNELYDTMIDKVMENIANFQMQGSNWTFKSIIALEIHTVAYEPLRGSSYIPLPRALATRKAIINLKNEDDECFRWAVLRAMNPTDKNPQRIDKNLKSKRDQINMDGIEFPVSLKSIDKVEKQNPNISINVFGYEDCVYPLRVSKVVDKTAINLLLISDDEKQHYCLIENMSRLLSSQTGNQQHTSHYCMKCLNPFHSQEALSKHIDYCYSNEAVKVDMPDEETTISFKNIQKSMRMPFIVYADFESFVKPIDTCEPNPSKSYTKQYQKHTPSSFCYYIKCFDDNVYTKDPVTYTAKTNDEDVAQKFVEMLEEDVKKIYKIPAKAMIFGEKEREDFERATECWICQGKLKGDDKVRDHCHYTGKYRGAAHNKCNLKYKKPSFIPVVFHNLSGYDSHLFIKNLGASQGNIKCIPNNEEKYISFTKDVVIDSYTVKTKQKSPQKIVEKNDVPKKTTDATTDECEQDVDNDVDWESIMYGYDESVFAEYYDNVPTADDESIFADDDEDDSEDIDDEEPKKKNIVKQLRFIDSFRFMASSLDKLSSNLDKSCFTNTSRYYDGKQLELLLRKGVYPYEYMDSIERLAEKKLPPKESFYSRLSGDGISDEDYEHAQRVWETFGMTTLRDYHDLYNQSDVLLLADIFENFRDVCSDNYGLDPAWYYTAPGLAWDAALKITDVKLELLSDPDMLLMIEKGIRGGISMISNRYGKANNPYMGSKFDNTEETRFISYLDANNLYGWAMSKPLPTHGFKWMDDAEKETWKSVPCILEVDLEYPEHLHDLHNDYPLAPESLKIGRVDKLIPNLNNKTNYVIHYENLKLYESLGLKITKIHRGIKFEESTWLKQYIDLNTTLRAKANNDFEKDFFKLMNNSVFGKTMENIRNRVDVRLVNDKRMAKKLAAKPNFKHCTIFDENLVAIHMKKTKLVFDKPVYLGMCILDLSKTLMYDFHYNYMKTKYGTKAKLLFTDTDSLAYEIKTEDFYKDIAGDVAAKFDTSNFPKNHPSGIPTGINKKVVGMFKDEAGGEIIEEFVGLRAKLYSYKMLHGNEEKRCKGVKKPVVKKTIQFEDYKRCLFTGKEQLRTMNVIRSHRHNIYTEEVNKVALSANDDKRVISKDGIHTLAHGHNSLNKIRN